MRPGVRAVGVMCERASKDVPHGGVRKLVEKFFTVTRGNSEQLLSRQKRRTIA